MASTLQRFWCDEEGATAIEYGLIAALVSVAGIGAFNVMADSLSSLFNTVSSTLSNVAQSS